MQLLKSLTIKQLFFIILGIGIFSYLPWIVGSMYVSDDVAYNSVNNPWIWRIIVSEGRWVRAFIFQVMYGTPQVIPAQDTILSVIFLALATTIFVQLIVKDNLSKLILGSMIIASPIPLDMIQFSQNGIYTTLGILLAILSVYQWHRNYQTPSKSSIFMALIFLTMAIGCYQSTLTVFITATIAYTMVVILPSQDIKVVVKNILIAVGILIVSIILSSIIARLTMIGNGIKPTEYFNDKIHTISFKIFWDVAKYPFRENTYISSLQHYIFIPMIVFAIMGTVRSVKGPMKKLLGLGFMVTLILSPFMILLFYEAQPRSLNAWPFMIGTVMVLAMQSIKKEYWQKGFMIITAIITLQSAHIIGVKNHGLTLENNSRQYLAYAMTLAVDAAIANMDNKKDSKVITVAIVDGLMGLNPSPTSRHALYLLKERMKFHAPKRGMNLVFWDELSQQKKDAVQETMESMSTFPDIGSVQDVDGIIILKVAPLYFL